MTLEQIGRLALNYRIKQRAFETAIKKSDETRFSKNPYSYEPERLALLASEREFNLAADAFIDAG